MRQYSITAPRHIDVTIDLPASKSISNRALIIHALAGGNIRPQNLSDCDDTEVVINALDNMPETIDIKAAGTAMRFMTAYLSVTPGEHVITGTERMKQRPIGILVDALRYLGADIEYVGNNGFPPLRIRGRALDGGYIEMPGNVSSQFISALLMIGPVLRKGLELKLTGEIVSRPYIDLTLHVMHEYGSQAEWTDVDTITVSPVPYKERPYIIENDWSAASYWYEMLALTDDMDSSIRLTGLADASRQGDSVVKHLFSLLGVKTEFRNHEEDHMGTVTLTRHNRILPRLAYDFIASPDLAQTFVVTCCALNIPFEFTGLGSLRIKETDRMKALGNELHKIGYNILSRNNSELLWTGSRQQPTMEPIDTYEDHRMALAFAPVSIKMSGLRINNPEVVSKSYPHYWDDLRKAGFTIEESEV